MLQKRDKLWPDGLLVLMQTWPGLFESWIMWFVLLTYNHWIAIYPVDSVSPFEQLGLLITDLEKGKREIQTKRFEHENIYEQ